MNRGIATLRLATALMGLAGLVLGVSWSSGLLADQDIEETASEQGLREDEQSGSSLLDVSRTFEEELKDLLSWRPYIYESLGRRDPFGALVTNQESDEMQLSDLPDPRGLALVGVLWGEKDRFALVEEWSGRSFVLREGDPVWNGHVVRVEQRRVVIRYNHFGMWKTINIPLKTGKETINALER